MMSRLFRMAVVAAMFFVVSVLPALGWDDVGHKISAFIAWQRMSPAARENVMRILRAAPEDSQLATFYMQYGPEPEETRRREYFMLVATWADIVRDRGFENRYKKYHHSNWHYSDTFWRQTDGRAEMLTGFDEGGQAVAKLVEFDKLIRSTAAPDKDKAIAIAWIMHLGGDLHQPLHTSARVTDLEPKGDQGANLFLLSPKETPRADQLNLHWFWDSIIERNKPLKGEECERNYLESLGNMIMKKYPFSSLAGRMELGQYSDWQKESFALNPTDVFTSDLKRFEAPSARYKKHAFMIAERQLAIAGYRLGETLNSVFGTAPELALND